MNVDLNSEVTHKCSFFTTFNPNSIWGGGTGGDRPSISKSLIAQKMHLRTSLNTFVRSNFSTVLCTEFKELRQCLPPNLSMRLVDIHMRYAGCIASKPDQRGGR